MSQRQSILQLTAAQALALPLDHADWEADLMPALAEATVHTGRMPAARIADLASETITLARLRNSDGRAHPPGRGSIEADGKLHRMRLLRGGLSGERFGRILHGAGGSGGHEQ